MNAEHMKNLNRIYSKLILSLFSKNFETTEICQAKSIPDFPSKYMVQIALRNRSYQISMILGVPQDTSDYILNGVCAFPDNPEEKDELIRSAFGELCNSVACEFSIMGLTISDYGKLLPTPPLVWVTESMTPDFIPADGLSGELHSDHQILYTYLSAMKSMHHSGNWSPTRTLSIYDPHSTENET
ncbi:MAG: hypothetical protein H6618_09955 [Deltaproteobacteria bacterium]|nr:hypothetical protein [Deltaproteobacteria bacterium]